MNLKQRIASLPKELQANWPAFREAFDAHLTSLTSEESFTAGRSNEELGIALKAVAEIRKNLNFEFEQPKQPKQPRLKPII